MTSIELTGRLSDRFSGRHLCGRHVTTIALCATVLITALAYNGNAYAANAPVTVNIVTPTPKQTFWNIGGRLVVDVAVDGVVPDDAHIALQYDGAPAATVPLDSKHAGLAHVELEKVWRGTHTVSAKVMARGATLAQSATVTFYVHQHSVLLPKAH